QMISHKVLRWYLWMFLSLVLVCNIMLVRRSPGYTVALGVQAAFYLTAALGIYAASYGRRVFLVSTVSLFLIGNVAMSIGFFRSVSGRTTGAWETSRRQTRTEQYTK
ncbi:MAG: hypothetical protein ACYDC1_22740, partial [Limisphaerales bacterium]